MLDEMFRSIDNLGQSFRESLQARTVYGEAVSANGVTVIPVAQVRFGFGGGGGSGRGDQPGEDGQTQSGSGGGGGGGGGGRIDPIGFIEITSEGARWVPLEPSRAEIALRALTAAAVLVPGGGRRGFFGRLALVVASQAAIAAFMRPRVSLPQDLRFGSAHE